MTNGDGKRRFEPAPRRVPTRRLAQDAQNLRGELVRILHRTESVAESRREGFTESSSHYDVASMVVIRLAALLERPEFAASARLLTSDEVAAIRTTRNIAAHAGYDGMNDDLFWIAVTVRVPSIIHRLLDSWPR